MVVIVPDQRRNRKRRPAGRGLLVGDQPKCARCGGRFLKIVNGAGVGCCCEPAPYYPRRSGSSRRRSGSRRSSGSRRRGSSGIAGCQACQGDVTIADFLLVIPAMADAGSPYCSTCPTAGGVFVTRFWRQVFIGSNIVECQYTASYPGNPCYEVFDLRIRATTIAGSPPTYYVSYFVLLRQLDGIDGGGNAWMLLFNNGELRADCLAAEMILPAYGTPPIGTCDATGTTATVMPV